MKELLSIFWTFCRVGALTFGGGYAMLPILEKEAVERQHWITKEEMLDYYAIGQCLPGVIAVNTATFIGRKQRGVAGGIAAALGIVFPSLVIIVIIASFVRNFLQYEVVQRAFAGIRVAVAALIVDAIIKLWKSGIKDGWTLLFFGVVLALSLLGVSPVIIVVLAVAYGIGVSALLKRRAEK